MATTIAFSKPASISQIKPIHGKLCNWSFSFRGASYEAVMDTIQRYRAFTDNYNQVELCFPKDFLKLSGQVYGHNDHPDGTFIDTSYVMRLERIQSANDAGRLNCYIAVTASDRCYEFTDGIAPHGMSAQQDLLMCGVDAAMDGSNLE